MPKYLFEASYTAEGAKGLLKDGGSGRRTAVEQLVKGLVRWKPFASRSGTSTPL
jgi:hypothetical protein